MVFGRIAEEMPRHTVVQTRASYEIRRYEPSVAVMCDYATGWGASADGTPFGSLARYIGVSRPYLSLALASALSLSPSSL